MIEELNKAELLKLIEKAEQRIAELDQKEAEAENAPVILKAGKTYKTRDGKKITIVKRNISIYIGIDQSYKGKDIGMKYPEFYIDGKRSKNKLSDGDLIEEIVNG